MTKCIIIDDEPLAIKLLASYCSEIDQVEVLHTFSNPVEAIKFLKINPVDLIFLDIQMPELSGIDLVKIIDDQVSVIFTTAYPEYAVEGFEVNAVDYLLKPITFQRFEQAVAKFLQHRKGKIANDVLDDFIMVKSDYRLSKIKYDDILFLEGMGDYTAIHTSRKKTLTLEKMKTFEKDLPSQRFLRVHRSFIIALDKFQYIERNKIKIGTKLIPIGTTYQERFWERINRK